MNSGLNIILTSRNPLGALEGYLAAGFLRPIENFLVEQSSWLSRLTGEDRSRYDVILAGIRELQILEAEHGVGASIVVDHPFAEKMLRLNERRRFLPDDVLSNAMRYHTSHRRRTSTVD